MCKVARVESTNFPVQNHVQDQANEMLCRVGHLSRTMHVLKKCHIVVSPATWVSHIMPLKCTCTFCKKVKYIPILDHNYILRDSSQINVFQTHFCVKNGNAMLVVLNFWSENNCIPGIPSNLKKVELNLMCYISLFEAFSCVKTQP